MMLRLKHLAFFGPSLGLPQSFTLFPVCRLVRPSSSSVFPQVIRPPHLRSSSASFIFPESSV